MIALLADHLRQPLRDRNRWLLAAGYAPQHRETALESAQLEQLRRSMQMVIDAHEPFPAFVIDRRWTVQLTNQAAIRMAFGIEDHARGVPTNIFRISLHPEGFAGRTANFPAWSGYLLRQLDEAIARTRDDQLIALAEEIVSWPGTRPVRPGDRCRSASSGRSCRGTSGSVTTICGSTRRFRRSALRTM